jgi:aminoglycoside phosphotransferase (APT) family kinase protein
MTIATPAVLRLLRHACLEIAGTLTDERATGLERVALVLTRLITERESGETREGLLARSPRPDVAAEADYFWRYDERMKAALAEAATPTSSSPPGEDLNLPALTRFLRARFPDEPELSAASANVASRGFSKKTVFVTLAGVRGLPQELVLRIDQPANYLGTHVRDEFPVLQHLWECGVSVPRPLACEPTGAVLGQPFVVSERVSGAPIGGNFVFPARSEDPVRQVATAMARLHAAPLGPFLARHPDADDGRPAIDRGLERLQRDWAALATRSPTIEAAFDWIERHRSLAFGERTFVHDDCNFNNILFDQGRLIAIVDWEFANIGNPAADLGFFYYAAEAVSSFGHFLDCYAEAGGKRPSAEVLDFHILWGQLRLAVMGFQVDLGFQRGDFQDLRFALAGVHFLPQSIERVSRLLQRL